MATAAWNSVDEDGYEFKRQYCAFLDILGYKQKSERFFLRTYNLEKRLERAYANAFGVMKLNANFYDMSKIKTKFFSDSIIITADVVEGSEDELFGVVQFSALLSIMLSYEDLLIRGGISSGLYSEKERPDHSFIASEGLQKAYILESKRALNPRILFEAELLSELSGEGRNYIIKEKDELIVHFARSMIEGNAKADAIFKEMSDLDFARKQEPGQREKDKYTWVLDYYYWTITQERGIDEGPFKKFWSGEDRGFSAL